MADTDPNPKAGEKRPADSKAGEKRRPKVRRFDMKTRVPKAQVTDIAPRADSQAVEGGSDSTDHKEKPLIVTTIVTKTSEGSRNKSSISLSTTQERSAEIPESTEKVIHGAKDDVSVKGDKVATSDMVSDHMSVSKMFQTSFELQQAELGSGHKEERGQGRKNIVDQLFQDFVTTKMREVDDRGKDASGEDEAISGELESDKTEVAESIDEMKRLLDAEITSIQSRSVVTGFMPEDVVLSGHTNSDKTHVDLHSHLVEHSSTLAPPSDLDCKNVCEASHSLAQQSFGVAEVFTDNADLTIRPVDSGATDMLLAGGEVKEVLVRKKPEVKKLGLSIGAETLARITGNWKNGHILEEGEVASSTDSDGDKAFKVEPLEEESGDSDEVSGTGSLSDSDKGKEGKSKKKKKHKHKHKKKKKHKAQSKEKEREEEEKVTQSVEGKSSKEKRERKASKEKSDRKSSKETKKDEEVSEKHTKESKTKERRKNSHQKSKSPESFDPWDARNYRVDSTKRSRSRSPLVCVGLSFDVKGWGAKA